VRRVLPWRLTRHLLIAAAVAILPFLPHAFHFLKVRLPLRTSPLVGAAVSRASEHPGAVAKLGEGIAAGWFVKGYVRDDETGWSEGRLWIPVRGSRGDGTLYARAGRGSGPWVFAELELTASDGTSVDLLQPPSAPTRLGLQARARPYLVPLGDVRSVEAHDLPPYYANALGLSVELLAPLPLEPRAFDHARAQFSAPELVATMKRRLPALANDPTAVLIGLTDADIYIPDKNWRFAFSYREDERFAVVASARLTPFLHRLLPRESLLRSRVRKMVSKNIGLLVYRLPLSDDPTSLLYGQILGVDDLDLVQERFTGLGATAVVSDFQVSHRQPPATAEIAPEPAGRPAADDRYPCLRVTRQGSTFTAGMTECLPRPVIDEEVDELEIHLRSGRLMVRRTDLFVRDVVPLALTRGYSLWSTQARSFGVAALNAWDMFPVGTRQPYTWMELIFCDGNLLHYDRISRGTGYADAVYKYRGAVTAFHDSQIRWNGNGWDLRRQDGALFLFPEAYAAKRAAEAALTEFRDPRGVTVRLERDQRRNLHRIASSTGRVITLDYDANDRVVRAADDRGRSLRYVYDAGNRLSRVEGEASVLRLSYDGLKLTAIDEGDRRLVEVGYADQRPSSLSLAGGQPYRFRFDTDPRDPARVLRTTVTTPAGDVTMLQVDWKPRRP
jgi:YD repeat-containing protein